MTKSFEIEGHSYIAEGLNPLVESNMFRRMAPLFGPALRACFEPGKSLKDGVRLKPGADVLAAIGGILDGLSTLSDDDSGYIHREALGSLKRKDGGRWKPVWVKGADRPAFRDINGLIIMRLTAAVLGTSVRGMMDGTKDSFTDAVTSITKLR